MFDITPPNSSTASPNVVQRSERLCSKRVSDRSVLRLIRKWIQVGVIDQGQFLVSDKGTGQGQTISPLLANIYLHYVHYVLDEWFEEVVKPRLRGEAHEIRFAFKSVVPEFEARRSLQLQAELWPMGGIIR